MTTPTPDTPPPRRRGRPRTGVTPKRNVRVGAAWDELEALAKADTGETMSDVIKRLVTAELRRLRRKREREQGGNEEPQQ